MKKLIVTLLLTLVMGSVIMPAPISKAQQNGYSSPLLIIGNFKLTYFFTETVGYVACPPGNYSTRKWYNSYTFDSTNLYIFYICPNVKHSYNGYPTHCLTNTQNHIIRVNYRLSDNYSSTAVMPNSPYSLEGPDSFYIELLGNAVYSWLDENNKINLSLNVSIGSKYLYVTPQYYFHSFDPISNGVGNLIPVKVYNQAGQLITTINVRLFQKYDISNLNLPTGKYTFKIEPDTPVFNISSPHCPFTIKTKVQSVFTVDWDNQDKKVTYTVTYSPTPLDLINPRGPTGGSLEPEIPTAPEMPEFPEEEPEEGTGLWGKFIAWIKNILKDLFKCDEFTLSQFNDLYNSLYTKFPFIIFSDIRGILNNIGSSCPVTYIYGPNGISSVFSICQYIPSSVINFIKILINLIATIIFMFAILNTVKKFFEED